MYSITLLFWISNTASCLIPLLIAMTSDWEYHGANSEQIIIRTRFARPAKFGCSQVCWNLILVEVVARVAKNYINRRARYRNLKSARYIAEAKSCFTAPLFPYQIMSWLLPHYALARIRQGAIRIRNQRAIATASHRHHSNPWKATNQPRLGLEKIAPNRGKKSGKGKGFGGLQSMDPEKQV